MKVKQEFFGFNPVMWMGVVEDNEDPLKLGRLRVRIFGWHTSETDGDAADVPAGAAVGDNGGGGNKITDPNVGINDTKYARAYFNNFGIDVNDPATYPPNQVPSSQRAARGFPKVGAGMEELLERTPMSQIPEYANGKGPGGGGQGGSTGGSGGGDASEKVKTDDLPWAQVMQPVNGGPNSGIGGAMTGIVKGTWVMGMFLDGEIAREPLVMGAIGGIPTEPNPNPDGGPPIEGFYDPTGNLRGFPRETASWQLDEPDTNRLARNDNVKVHGDPADYVHNVINRKQQNQMFLKACIKGFDFHEPVLEGWDKFKAKYPHNKVWETKQGHIFEVDDTPAFERIHIYHQNGSYFNFDNGDPDNGPPLPRLVVKSTGDYYNFVQRNYYTAVPEGDIRSLSRHWSHLSENTFTVDAKAITLKGHTKIKGNVVVEALEVRSAATCEIVDITGKVHSVINGIVYANPA